MFSFTNTGRRVATAVALVGALAVAVAASLPGTRPLPVQAADLMTCRSPDVEFLGFSEALNKTSFGGFAVAELSGIGYDAERGVYYVVADRAGTVAAHVFTLSLPIQGDAMGTPVITSVARLAGSAGAPHTGLNFDAEGIAVVSNVGVFVASEGGSAAGEQPEIVHFSIYGGRLGELPVPAIFQVGTNNLSLEGMALSPSKRSLFTAMEVPLPADGRTADLRSRIRILRYEDRGTDGFAPAQQYFYQTEARRPAADLGVRDLIALSDTDLLVLESGFEATEGNTVRVFQVSLRGARDMAGAPSLGAAGLQPLAKTLVFDLADCPDQGASRAPGATQPNALLDNFEAMALGPELPGGRRALVLVSDDNSGTNQTTRIIVLGISVSKLAGLGGPGAN